MKSLKTIAEKRMGQKRKGYSIMKGFFRSTIEPERTGQNVEYAPCLQGGLPAFLHSAKNAKKFLHASYEIHQNTRVHMKKFDPSPYNEVFGTTHIDSETWRHAFNAMNVSFTFSFI